MIRCIQNKYMTMQGTFVRNLPCGRIVIRVGNETHTGQPVTEKE